MTVIKNARGTSDQWAAANPILLAGEIGVETDTDEFRIGKGLTPWMDLPAYITRAKVQALIDDKAAILTPYRKTLIVPATVVNTTSSTTLWNSGTVPMNKIVPGVSVFKWRLHGSIASMASGGIFSLRFVGGVSPAVTLGTFQISPSLTTATARVDWSADVDISVDSLTQLSVMGTFVGPTSSAAAIASRTFAADGVAYAMPANGLNLTARAVMGTANAANSVTLRRSVLYQVV